ncbi:hypothetical protein UFOVP891_38 [uncultured Caudovirales phage]|uniref:Uncharacterized protein n=1 Tax=uncultured Caudovirales phage TaxID=2100421 RepID=A0A6J5RQM8_9CAUD|nr:hypothetical protein UFOVP472_29 [uncultured Caudovirales phage]CAB4169131.1 hypothetical protein UFOVP891_38 [uncultured Caudovirales phage]CAB4180769.1 hypothetical protein UFOVP1053_29 [uncultured Caudovirales phage]CAB4195911.1 hypothetical protein UFOVP1297_44 [uncultured Caudovirales phage]CAB4221886.1 hypothetical protein UFOVP1647_22 [uncultured Caudovirales phage]
MTDIAHVFVMFECSPGQAWQAMERENIPDWLRDEAVIDRMLEGEIAKRPDEAKCYKAVEIDRPRPDGQHKLMARARMNGGKSTGGIVIPGM